MLAMKLLYFVLISIIDRRAMIWHTIIRYWLRVDEGTVLISVLDSLLGYETAMERVKCPPHNIVVAWRRRRRRRLWLRMLVVLLERHLDKASEEISHGCIHGWWS